MSFLALDAPATSSVRQLVVTVGPASAPHLQEMAGAGATAFRLNASHQAADELGPTLDAIATACPGVPVVVDLQGAKMRIDLDAPRPVESGERCRFETTGAGAIRVPHAEFFAQVAPGDTLSVDDGRVRFVVERTGSAWLDARALDPGRLLPRKGVNVEQHPVHLDGLTARDAQAVRVAAARGVRAFAYSFMTDGHEADWVRAAVPGAVVVGKVERREAVSALQEAASRVDALWICRGDLGAQLGSAALARAVSGVDPRRLGVPVLMAGQVLEHLTRHAVPTRSEVCHLYDLVERGFAGIVLSDETAVGDTPAHAVGVAAGLLASFLA